MRVSSILKLHYLSWSQQQFYRCLMTQQRLSHSQHGREPTAVESHDPDAPQSCQDPVFDERDILSRAVDRSPDEQYRRYLMKPDQPENAKLLRVAIIGAPNAGKSTFINSLMGWKVNAVSSKVHTTRRNTNAMANFGNTQIVFVDTPGVITPLERKKHFCERNMVTDPEQSLHEADIVGVIVDAANHWTRYKLHVEIMKVLFLNQDVPSFLILNKVDSVPKLNVMLDVTRKLSGGVVAGREIVVKSNVKIPHKDSKPTIEASLFDRLETKYGEIPEIKSKAITIDYKIDQTGDRQEWMSNFMKDMKSDDKENFSGEDRNEEINSDFDSYHSSEQVELSQEKVNQSDSEIETSLEKNEESSYQSEFLNKIKKIPQTVSRPSLKGVEVKEDNTDWLEKVKFIKEAVKTKKGWDKFERVFLVSSLNGDGIQEVREYLLEKAQPRDWMYHSSLVTDQDPYELARILVWQSILDNCEGSIPYMVYPEIIYWEVDKDGQLNIIMEVVTKNTHEMTGIIGENGKNMKAISSSAKQALLDAFQCDLKFKIIVKKKSKPGRTWRK